MKKGVYTIEQDLEIANKPQLDIERYFKIGNYLTAKEIKSLENYISANGTNAYIKFNRKKKKERIQIVPIVSETVSQVSTTKESVKAETKKEQDIKEILSFLVSNPHFRVQPIDPNEFIHFCRYTDLYYKKQPKKFNKFFPISLQLYIKEVIEDKNVERFIEKRLRVCFEKGIQFKEELIQQRRLDQSGFGLCISDDNEIENETYKTCTDGLIRELSNEHDMNSDQISNLLDKVSFDYLDFKKALNKTQNLVWMDFEDSILKGTQTDNPLFRRLVGYKGEDRVMRRRRYLGLLTKTQ